jgi:hypothetical protein
MQAFAQRSKARDVSAELSGDFMRLATIDVIVLALAPRGPERGRGAATLQCRPDREAREQPCSSP